MRYRTLVRISGEKLKALRGKRSPREVAAAIGASPQALCNWEHGHNRISGVYLAALLLYYGAGIGEVVETEEVKPAA